jgi:hypothetical protein
VTFLAPFLLSLAAFAGVPLLVHLLRRRVTRRVEFPAVRFLLQTQREHSRERAVRNRLLLLLRLIAVLALVAAAARPMANLGGTGHPPIAVAIVLDQSMSTRAVVDGSTVFSRLQQAARSVTSQLAADDRAWLVTNGGRVSAGDAAALNREIDSLLPLAGTGDLTGAVKRAAALVAAGAPRTPVIVVLTDGQHAAIDTTITIDDIAVVVHAPDVSLPQNRVVHDVRVEPARWVPGGRLAISLSAPDSAAWRVVLGDRTVSRGVVAASEFSAPQQITVVAQAEDSGWMSGRVEMDADDFPGDDARAFAVLAGAPPSVVVQPSAGPFVDAAVDVLVTDGRLQRSASRSGAAVVVTSAADEVSQSSLRLAPLDPLQVVSANRALERAGIPWRFGAVRRDTVLVEDEIQSVGLEPKASLAGTRVMMRYRLDRVAGSSAASDSGVVLATAGGQPWIVAGSDYVLIASPLHVAATNAPVLAAFVPWLRDIVTQRLSDGGTLALASPNDTINMPVVADSLRLPDGTQLPLAGGRLVVPQATGVYLFRSGARTVGALVVNAEVEESDVTAWGGDIWQDRIIGSDVQLEPRGANVAEAVFDRSGGRSLTWPLVALAALALFAEALIARGVFAPRAAHAVHA